MFTPTHCKLGYRRKMTNDISMENAEVYYKVLLQVKNMLTSSSRNM